MTRPNHKRLEEEPINRGKLGEKKGVINPFSDIKVISQSIPITTLSDILRLQTASVHDSQVDLGIEGATTLRR